MGLLGFRRFWRDDQEPKCTYASLTPEPYMAFTMTGLPPIRMHYPSLATQECRPDTPANSTINRNIASLTAHAVSPQGLANNHEICNLRIGHGLEPKIFWVP